jgi:hypothetical protein
MRRPLNCRRREDAWVSWVRESTIENAELHERSHEVYRTLWGSSHVTAFWGMCKNSKDRDQSRAGKVSSRYEDLLLGILAKFHGFMTHGGGRSARCLGACKRMEKEWELKINCLRSPNLSVITCRARKSQKRQRKLVRSPKDQKGTELRSIGDNVIDKSFSIPFCSFNAL